MSAAAFRQADVQRLIRAFTSEGLPAPRVEIDRRTGRIIALPTAAAVSPDDELDALIKATGNGKSGA